LRRKNARALTGFFFFLACSLYKKLQVDSDFAHCPKGDWPDKRDNVWRIRLGRDETPRRSLEMGRVSSGMRHMRRNIVGEHASCFPAIPEAVRTFPKSRWPARRGCVRPLLEAKDPHGTFFPPYHRSTPAKLAPPAARISMNFPGRAADPGNKLTTASQGDKQEVTALFK